MSRNPRVSGPLVHPEDYLDAVIELRCEWPLSNLQSVAILEVLTDLGGVALEGVVNDRLGRSGVLVSLSTRRQGSYRDLVVFDKVTGQLLEADTMTLAGVPGSRARPSTVISYVAWR